MNIFVSILLFLAGIALVVKGGDWFVDAASRIARAFNIPTFIIGATIVSFATTLPEMIVSVMASLEGKNDMAVGNAIGSVTANTGLIMSLAFLFMLVVTPREKFQKQILLLIAATGILWLGSLSGQVAGWACAILIAIFFASMYFNVKDARKERNNSESPEPMNRNDLIKNILLFIIGAVCIVLGSNFLINGGSDIATALGVPERIIAITMVAIGTSLPELVTTITAIKKKESHMSVGNIIGANIVNIALILPVCSFVSKGSFAVSPTSLAMDFPACMLVTLVAVLPLLFKQKASKLQGGILLACYIGYLVLSLA